MTTRDEGRRIASDYLPPPARPRHSSSHRPPVGEIIARRPAPYFARPVRQEECWVCYLEPQGRMMLTSSEIIIVSNDTGDVVYAGAAGDEG
jgi:hypothetical protein